MKRSKNSYQCVVPKTMDDDRQGFTDHMSIAVHLLQLNRPWIPDLSEKHFKILDRPNCWNQCGRKRGWAGRCNYCGENGYCCNQDGRGSCTREMSQVLKEWFCPYHDRIIWSCVRILLKIVFKDSILGSRLKIKYKIVIEDRFLG